MTQPADCGGTSKNSWQTKRMTTTAGCRTGTAGGYLVTVLAVVIFSGCLDVGHCFSSTAVPCPLELISCLGNEDCGACLAILQDGEFVAGVADFELCSELYAEICVTVDSAGCDTENIELVTLLTCAAEDLYACTEFTTCADATAGSGTGGLEGATEAPAPLASAATPTPSNAATATATDTPSATPAPAPTFTTPTFPLLPTTAPAAAPPAGSPSSSTDVILDPTAAPTAGVSRALNTAYPSAALLEGITDTMAPSTASAAPTGFDVVRGGEGVFSESPTAAPTAFEGLLEDDANGGVVSRFTAGSALSVVSAAAMVGFVSAVAASAV